MSRRPVALPLFACVALAAAALAAAAGSDESDLAFTLSVRTVRVAATLDPGEQACQRRVDREAEFDSVEFAYLDPPRRGQDLSITVYDSASRRVLARGGPDRIEPALPAGDEIDVCLANGGPGRVALLGGRAHESHTSGGDVPSAGVTSGRNDIALVFRRTEPKSALAQVPDVFRRAAVFRPVGAWAYWVLLAALLVAVPALLARAIARATP